MKERRRGEEEKAESKEAAGRKRDGDAQWTRKREEKGFYRGKMKSEADGRDGETRWR